MSIIKVINVYSELWYTIHYWKFNKFFNFFTIYNLSLNQTTQIKIILKAYKKTQWQQTQ